MKKVIIKIHEDGQVEIISKDKDVAVVLQYPDGAEVDVYEGDKKKYHSEGCEDEQ